MDEQEVEQEREYYYFAIKYCTENIFLLCAYSNSRSFKRSICMKNKKWISLAAAVVLAVTALPMGVFAAKKDGEEEKLTKVTLNEVAHSIFYAPQYVACLLYTSPSPRD